MRRIVESVAWGLLLGVTALAPASAQEGKAPAPKQSPVAQMAASLPSVDELIDKYVKAIGGKAALQKLTSRVTKGTFEVPEQGIVGSIEAYAKAPNKNASVVEITDIGKFRQGFDGQVGWMDNPQMGLRELTGQELSNTRRSAEFYQVLKLHELYPKMALKGKQKLGERDVYVIEADPGDGSIRRMFLDAENGLLVKNEVDVDAPQGRFTVEVYFSDYKEVDGVKLPFTIRQINPNIAWVIRATEVQHNVPVDDAKFAKPPAN